MFCGFFAVPGKKCIAVKLMQLMLFKKSSAELQSVALDAPNDHTF